MFLPLRPCPGAVEVSEKVLVDRSEGHLRELAYADLKPARFRHADKVRHEASCDVEGLLRLGDVGSRLDSLARSWWYRSENVFSAVKG
jgi:hypothetical protein